MREKLLGKFIVFDGPDGCGKSTQIELLAEWLNGRGVEVEVFRDPGGTAIGEKIRQVLLNPDNAAMDTRTELLLYMAARAQLWAERISTALKENKCVLLDRWVSSTCAYQGFAGGFGVEKVIEIAEGSLERVWPDLTVILDIDLETAAARMDRELDRMELKGQGYHKKVREGFLELAKGRGSFVVVDAAEEIKKVHEKIIKIIEGLD